MFSKGIFISLLLASTATQSSEGTDSLSSQIIKNKKKKEALEERFHGSAVTKPATWPVESWSLSNVLQSKLYKNRQ